MIALTPRNEELAHALVALNVERSLELLRQGAEPAKVDAFFLGKGQGGCVSVLLKAVADAEDQQAFALASANRSTGEALDIKATLASQAAPQRAAVLGLVKALKKVDPELLLENRARGLTPLQEAATLGWGRLVSWMADQGVDLNETNGYGRTAAHYAALWGHRDTLKRLHTRGVDLDVQDQDQHTPAHLAATQQHINVMRSLWHYGADFGLANTKGKTPGETLGMHDAGLVTRWQAWEKTQAALPEQPDQGPRRSPRP